MNIFLDAITVKRLSSLNISHVHLVATQLIVLVIEDLADQTLAVRNVAEVSVVGVDDTISVLELLNQVLRRVHD